MNDLSYDKGYESNGLLATNLAQVGALKQQKKKPSMMRNDPKMEKRALHD